MIKVLTGTHIAVLKDGSIQVERLCGEVGSLTDKDWSPVWSEIDCANCRSESVAEVPGGALRALIVRGGAPLVDESDVDRIVFRLIHQLPAGVDKLKVVRDKMVAEARRQLGTHSGAARALGIHRKRLARLAGTAA